MADEETTPIEGEKVAEETPEPIETPETGEVVETPAPEPSISEVLEKLEKMERRTQYLQRKLDQPAKAETQKEIVPQPAGRPDIQNFDTTAEYEDALFEWRDNERERKTRINDAQTREAEALQNFNDRAEALRMEHADFDEVIESPVFTPNMRMACAFSENGPAVAYHLGRPENRAAAERIRKLPPEIQLVEMGKLETQILINKKTKTVTKAPPPITPVGSSAAPTKEPNANSPIEEWMAWEKEKQFQRRKSEYGG